MTKTQSPHSAKQSVDNRSVQSSHVALRAISDGVVVTNSRGGVEFLNPAAEALSGWSSSDAADHTIDEVLELREETTGARVSGVEVLTDSDFCAKEMGRCTLRSRSGEQHVINANVSPVLDKAGLLTGTVLILKDLSTESGLRQRLDHQAMHDALTGLLNRTAFEQAIENLQNDNVGASKKHAVVYLDIDQFKIINDTCGHAAGDHYLVLLAEKLRSRVRENDVLARLGGDEFGVLLKGCSLDHAQDFANEICDLIAHLSFVWNGSAHRHTASIGVHVISGKDDVRSILSAADVACFTAKDLGRNRVHVYHDGQVPSRHLEMQWVARISRALDEDRLSIYQQPIIAIGDTENHSKPHYELLVRLTDRFGQIILPKHFIAAAERYNLMPRIDRWVVNAVLSKYIWRQEFSNENLPYKLSINLSGVSLSDDGFMSFLEAALDADPIEPGTLCFEITETATISNISRVAEFMRRLKIRGVQFSLDDFGSGLSSFAYLKNLPVDLIKIDGNFVADVLVSDADAAVVDAITRVGKAMNIKTVAECVESAEVLAALQKIGVDYAQGYYFARPRVVRSRSSFVDQTSRVFIASA